MICFGIDNDRFAESVTLQRAAGTEFQVTVTVARVA